MMKVPMDNALHPSSGNGVKRPYTKNVELENRRGRSTQARIPTDPNAWQQIRENFEAMILKDHAYSERPEIEYALWQLHYKRIEELRSHFLDALDSSSSISSQSGKISTQPDRITKLRSKFKIFLSDATGFYHELMLKIRAKYGLSLDDLENQIGHAEDGNKSAEVKKGLISCHRCLIYLGDLARYKELYGEGDTKLRDFGAASSYYVQASSLWPSSGNPHHQLAILASYSGDELVSIYQYFRSLAVDDPFSTARDNLIMTFEKNRQSYTQLLEDEKSFAVKDITIKMTGKRRGKGESRMSSKVYRTDVNPVKEKESSIPEIFKNFSIRFIRLNGILFTRTSLETFGEVFTTTRRDFLDLLTSGSEEQFNFGSSATECGIVIVRIIAILIFTVQNAYRETENPSYAEILQRSVLLQNAFTATFEFMGHALERCFNLHEPSTSYLCPGVLVFVEWLACRPDVASRSETEEIETHARSFFWKNCINFMNKLLSSEFFSTNDENDEIFFSNMSSYDEGETCNTFALWEDIELRGFLPLAPAHLILDFSKKFSLVSDGVFKEKKARVQRIVAAGKALANVIRIDQQGVYFDSKLNKFVIGVEPQISNDDLIDSNIVVSVNEHLKDMKINIHEEEEEEEIIVFKPLKSDKSHSKVHVPVSTAYDNEKNSFVEPGPVSHNGNVLQNAFDTSFRPPSSLASIALEQNLQPIHLRSKWVQEQQSSINNGLNKLSFVDTGIASNFSHSSTYSGQVSEIPSKFDAIMSPPDGIFDRVPVNKSKNPVGRPVRHVGPPPGFHHVSHKIVDEQPMLVGNVKNDNLQMDDYTWLDGYQRPVSTLGTVFNNPIDYSGQILNHVTCSNNSTGIVNFPFPGKQVLGLHDQAGNQKWNRRQGQSLWEEGHYYV